MWFDKTAITALERIRDLLAINTFVETGTYWGIGTRFFAMRFKEVHTCDINQEYLIIAKEKCKDLKNVTIHALSSPLCLTQFRQQYEAEKRKDIPLFFLDAHWYDYWPLLDELAALQGFKNCVIIIHDFALPGMGFDSYYRQPLDFDYVADSIHKVNPHFYLYQNTKEKTEVWTLEDAKSIPGLVLDKETVDCFNHAWKEENNRYRGMLFCLPVPLDKSFPFEELYV